MTRRFTMTASTSSPSSSSPQLAPQRNSRDKGTRLPSLFATETHLLGWQGLSATLPANWNLASFEGNETNGKLRVDDEDGPRLEMRWEPAKGTPDLERSITQSMQRLSREAAKKKQQRTIVDGVRLVSKSRKRKLQLAQYGWIGEREDVIGQGWGVAWHCGDCGRVVVAEVMGRGREQSEKVQRLASEVLGSLECHGSGGWQTWSVFDLRLEVPEEFRLSRARLLTGRFEIEWIKPRTGGIGGWLARDQRLTLTRLSLADTLLQNQSLEEWARQTIVQPDKRWAFKEFEETRVRDHPALLAYGKVRDLRRRAGAALLDFLLRRRTPPAELRVWHCQPSNKLFALSSELASINAHVIADVLDSLDCH
jgi:hypothetical protein